MNVYGYLRVSGLGQVDGDGFDRQSVSIAKYVRDHYACNFVCWYAENGVSGTLEDRPALSSMLLDIEENGGALVVIEKLDRLARDLMTQENIIRDLQRRGVTLISVAEPDLCSDDPSRKLFRQIIGAIAEYDRRMIVARTRVARERIRGRGERCEGRKPFGFRPHEQAVLTRMEIMASEGLNWTCIARELNGAGVKPRKGKLWYPATVGKILRRTA